MPLEIVIQGSFHYLRIKRDVLELYQRNFLDNSRCRKCLLLNVQQIVKVGAFVSGEEFAFDGLDQILVELGSIMRALDIPFLWEAGSDVVEEAHDVGTLSRPLLPFSGCTGWSVVARGCLDSPSRATSLDPQIG